jgi:hypothetical protein
MKHTNQKWHYYQEGSFNFGISNDTGRHIADISKNANIPTSEKEANAQLIAAAPELLQMVIDLKGCIKRLTEDRLTQFERDREAQWIGGAHELILKATGQIAPSKAVINELPGMETEHLCPIDANQENFENPVAQVMDYFDNEPCEKAPLPKDYKDFAGYEPFGKTIERLKGK